MQMVKKIFIMLLVIWAALLVFMPKQEIYYQLEKELAKNEIKINEKSIEEGWFSLTLNQVTVYAKGVKVATVEKIDFFTVLFYSKIELRSFLLDDSLRSVAPSATEQAVLSHSLLSPRSIAVDANGSFGTIVGKIDLSERKIHIDFTEPKEIEMIREQLKKDEKGWYYERSF